MMLEILLVEDNPGDARLVQLALEQASADRFSSSHVDTLQAAISALEHAAPDLVLLDLHLPDSQGDETLRRVVEACPQVPVVILTGTDDEVLATRALRLGAQDFLVKGRITTPQLIRALSFAVIRKGAQKELAAKTAELESANERLRIADRYKDEFLSVISHELRTPLHFIVGFNSIIRDELAGPITDKQAGYLDKIQEGADRMCRLVEDLLDMAQIKAGKLRLDLFPSRIDPIVRNAVAQLDPLLAHRHVRLSLDLQATATVPLDERRIFQVVLNLLDNALKFTRDGDITIRTSDRDGDVLVEVHDTGVGISEDDLPRLFERFGQLDMSSTRETGGFGLGLAICKAIIDAHGGTIGVRSQPGAGSIFWFTIPSLSPVHAAAAV